MRAPAPHRRDDKAHRVNLTAIGHLRLLNLWQRIRLPQNAKKAFLSKKIDFLQ